MSFISRITTWATDQLLTSFNLNGEFNNIINTLNTAFTNIKVNAAGYVEGTILQLAVEGSTSTQTSSSSSTYADVTSLNVSITPLSVTSVIRIRITVPWVVSNNATQKVAMGLRVVRGASTVVRQFDAVTGMGSNTDTANNMWGTSTLICEDSPGTTSSTTYKVQVNAFSNTAVINDNTWATETAYITCDEIAQ